MDAHAAAMKKAREKERDQRNINPTAEAVIAMNLYASQYADQSGGSMDFWDKLPPERKDRCKALAKRVREADKYHGVRR